LTQIDSDIRIAISPLIPIGRAHLSDKVRVCQNLLPPRG
jgi:hypothetical protein